MTDPWFDEYMFRLVMTKKYATPQVPGDIEAETHLVAAWDRCSAPEN